MTETPLEAAKRHMNPLVGPSHTDEAVNYLIDHLEQQSAPPEKQAPEYDAMCSGCGVRCLHCHEETTKLTSCLVVNCPVKAVYAPPEAAPERATRDEDYRRPVTWAGSKACQPWEPSPSAVQGEERTAAKPEDFVAKWGRSIGALCIDDEDFDVYLDAKTGEHLIRGYAWGKDVILTASSSPTATAQRGETGCTCLEANDPDCALHGYGESPLDEGCTCPSWHTAGSAAVSGWMHHSNCALNKPDPLPPEEMTAHAAAEIHHGFLLVCTCYGSSVINSACPMHGQRQGTTTISAVDPLPAQTEPGLLAGAAMLLSSEEAERLHALASAPSPAPECAHESVDTREPFNYLGMPGTCKLCGKPVELRWATAPSLPTEGEGP